MPIKFQPLDPPRKVSMKKPVKPTTADIQRVAEKRKHLLITVRRDVNPGTLDDVAAQVMTFASENDVAVSDVTFGRYNYYRFAMKIRRRETDAEREKRVRNDLECRYTDKKWEYDRWAEQEKWRKENEKLKALKDAGKCIHCGK